MNKTQQYVLLGGGSIFLLLLILLFSISSNDGGYRTVVQWPSGAMEVKFEEGWFIAPFAKETKWGNVVSYDMENGINVRYQDGGQGTIDGTVRAQLPNDEASMLKIHREFLSEDGLINKLFIPEIKQALNQTAGLLTSEEAYAEKRSYIADWAEAIMEKGRFVTKVEQKELVMTDGTKQRKNVPVISEKDGQPLHQGSPFKDYGLSVSGFQVTNIDFEAATQKQINSKRDAEMGSITARANADQALWQTKEVVAKGEKAVAETRYTQLKEKEREIVLAEQRKAVAVMAAVQQREVNEQNLLAAKIDAQTASEQAKATLTRAEADAKAKRMLMEADGNITLKMETTKAIHGMWSSAYANRKQADVPSVMMGQGVQTSNNASNFMQMMEAKLARDLAADVKVSN